MIERAPVEMRDVAPWVERLARVGYAAKGVLYITVGLLAAQAGLGPGGETTDTHGALRVVLGLTFGHILLFVAAAGLMGYALWRLVEAVVDPDGRGDGISDPRQWTAFTFGLPGGELLVLLAAGGITVYGGYQLFRAYTAKLGRQLDLSPLPARAAGLVVGVSRFGIAARGIVFCLVGFFLWGAAVDHDAGQAGGLEKSLDTLAGIGRWPFVAVASGLVAYGLYELVNARYRRISVE